MSRLPFLRWPVPALALAAALAVAACDVPKPQTNWADINYAHRGAFDFDVAEIVVEPVYVPPLEPPHVEHLMPAAPAELAARWARDRLVAAGSRDRVIYRILEASVVETALDTESGVTGYFTIPQSERYDAHLVVELVLLHDNGNKESVKVSAERSVTVPEDASLLEREKIWYELSETVMNDFDSEMERAVREHLAAHLVN